MKYNISNASNSDLNAEVFRIRREEVEAKLEIGFTIRKPILPVDLCY